MSRVAWPNQTPIGTASNFLQCNCSKSYWQGYDLRWYKDMGAPCFPQPNLWLARCASMSWTALKKFVVLSIQRLRVGIKPFIPLRAESVAGFVGAPSAPSVVSVPSCAVLACRLRRLATCCEMVSAAKQPRYATTMFPNQPEAFPLSAGVSRPYLPPAPNKATETDIFFTFSFSAKCLEQRQ